MESSNTPILDLEQEAIKAEELSDKPYLVTEIFGPTIQGEGLMAGKLTVFVRLHLCDFSCSWCDTKYTWQKSHPDYNKFEKLTAQQIVDKVTELYKAYPEDSGLWVTISGGNPLLQLVNPTLLELLTEKGYRTQIETQGSVYRDSMDAVDLVVVSPKPPSSGMSDLKDDLIKKWIRLHDDNANVTFKIVVFDKNDYDWAYKLYQKVRQFEDELDTVGRIPFTLQVGTLLDGAPTDVVLDGYRDLVDLYLKSGVMHDVAVLPQVHVLIWGRRKGV